MPGRQFWVGPLWLAYVIIGGDAYGALQSGRKSLGPLTHPRWHNSKLSEGRETHYTDENDAHFRVTPLTLLLRFGVFSLTQRSGVT